MDRRKSALALTVAGLFVAGPALAQSAAPAGGDTPKPAPTGQDPAKPDKPSAPSAAPKADTKSDGMKSDTMKSDKMHPAQAGKAAAADANREQTKAAQQALRDKGHDPGAIDGVMGPKTQAALKDFQKGEGLSQTGRLDAETMAKLGVEGSPSASPRTAPGAAPRPEGGTAKDKQPAGKSPTR